MKEPRLHEPAGIERYEPAPAADLECVDELTSLEIEEMESRLTPTGVSWVLSPVYRQVGWGC